jgi:hypothetical protein
MNEQQLVAVKQAMEALKEVAARTGPRWALEQGYAGHLEAITALQSIIAQHALDKMAENARELGLSYDDAVKGGTGIMLDGKRIDPASIYKDAPPKQDVPETNFGNMAKPKIGCVNHDCDQCKAVQETVGDWVWSWLMDWCKRNGIAPATQDSLFAMVKDARGKFESTPPAPQPAPVQEPDGYVYGNSYWEATNLRITDDVKRFGSPRYATPPAPQPVPVKTYHDGTPWPVAPNPWVGLTDEEVVQCQQGDVYHFYRCIEAKLKEKNT